MLGTPRAYDATAKARRLQAFVDKLYGGKKLEDVVAAPIAERRREVAREALEQADRPLNPSTF